MNTSLRPDFWSRLRWHSSLVGVGLLWIAGAVLSYHALYELAKMLQFGDPWSYGVPVVIDVAIWVGSMQILAAREQGRRGIEYYAWTLVIFFAVVTITGNALTAGAAPPDERLIHAFGPSWARYMDEMWHAMPAVTMILFSHLASLLMGHQSKQEAAHGLPKEDEHPAQQAAHSEQQGPSSLALEDKPVQLDEQDEQLVPMVPEQPAHMDFNPAHEQAEPGITSSHEQEVEQPASRQPVMTEHHQVAQSRVSSSTLERVRAVLQDAQAAHEQLSDKQLGDRAGCSRQSAQRLRKQVEQGAQAPLTLVR